MTPIARILAVGLSLSLLLLIVGLIRLRRLKEKYAILWLLTGSLILLLAVFDKLLYWLTNSFGIRMPINGILFLGLFFIIIINLHFSMVISNLSDQNKKLAQKFALFEAGIRDINKKLNKKGDIGNVP